VPITSILILTYGYAIQFSIFLILLLLLILYFFDFVLGKMIICCWWVFIIRLFYFFIRILDLNIVTQILATKLQIFKYFQLLFIISLYRKFTNFFLLCLFNSWYIWLKINLLMRCRLFFGSIYRIKRIFGYRSIVLF
jgi:hypothetical protein